MQKIQKMVFFAAAAAHAWRDRRKQVRGIFLPFSNGLPLVVVCLRMGYLTEIFMAVLTPTKRWMASKCGICLNLLAAIPLIFCQIFPGLSDLDGLFPSISLRCFLDGNIFCIEKCTGFPCSFLLPIPFWASPRLFACMKIWQFLPAWWPVTLPGLSPCCWLHKSAVSSLLCFPWLCVYFATGSIIVIASEKSKKSKTKSLYPPRNIPLLWPKKGVPICLPLAF